MGSLTRKARKAIKGNGDRKAVQAMLDEAEEQMLDGLRVMTSEEAEAIIGAKPVVLDTLLNGIKGATNLNFAAMRANGARRTAKVIELVSKNQVVLMTLLLYAFAAGMRHAYRIVAAETEGADAGE